MMEFLRPSTEVMIYLFLKLNVYYLVQSAIAGMTVWYTTGPARRFAVLGLIASLVGVFSLTLAPHLLWLSPFARLFAPMLNPFEGMAWIGICFATLLPATAYARRWTKALSISNGILFIVLFGSWMIAYSNI